MDNDGEAIAREAKRVTVYVWESFEANLVGHASLQIGKDIYLSLWPDSDPTMKKMKTGNKEEPIFLPNYEEDQKPKYEGTPADHAFDFYTLDNAKMLKAVEDLKKMSSGGLYLKAKTHIPVLAQCGWF
jgi:hypothetical protein